MDISKKTNNPLVSVIIPAASEERFIGDCVRSILAQTYANTEVLVVVNGSQDKTADVARAAGAHQVLNFTEPLGASLARNKGAELAKGDIFVFLDADSVLTKNTLQEIVSTSLHKRNSIGTCYAYPSSHDLPARLYVLFKNAVHFFRIYNGVYGMIFCPRELFFEIKGFNPLAKVAEFKTFIYLLKQKGGKYVFLTRCAITVSMRRFEKEGYLKLIGFWVKFWLNSSLKFHEAKIAEEYKRM